MCHLCDDRDRAVENIITVLRRSGQIKDFLLTGLILLFEGFKNAQDRITNPPVEPKLAEERLHALAMHPEGLEVVEAAAAAYRENPENVDFEVLGKAVMIWVLPELQLALAKMHGKLPQHFPVVMANLILNELLVEAWLEGEDDDEPMTGEERWAQRYEEELANISSEQYGEQHESARQAAREVARMGAISSMPGGQGIAFDLDQMADEDREMLQEIVGNLDQLAAKFGVKPPEEMAEAMDKLREELGLPQQEEISEEKALESFNAGIDAFLEELAQQKEEEEGGSEE